MTAAPSSYLAGRGLADITGEAAECGLLGYGKADQRSAGIHLRLRSRAFVLATSADGPRLLLVVAELPLVFDSISRAVLARLAIRFGDRYTEANTMLTCTHTHCGPGGYSHHFTYNATTGGFRPKTFAAIVDGIVESVEAADADLAPTELSLAFGEVHDASVNRSPTSFDLDPADERSFFPDRIDPQTTLLAMHRGGRLVGAVNWFATHGTSMTNRNMLISSDNKGYAAYHWERLVSGIDYLAASAPEFVGAFAQTNAGDMSPNLNRRPGSGPTEDEFENTRIVGARQFAAAEALVGAGQPIAGPLDTRLTYINLADCEVAAEFCADGRPHRTSGPYASAGGLAGTDEGKGFAGFRQGRNRLVDAVSTQLVYRLGPRIRDAQEPKGLVLPRSANRVLPLMQERIPVQLVRLGQLYLIGVPAEVTIVAGLRLRRAVSAIVDAPLSNVLVAGYSNGYVHYVTTPEEYAGQRYEAGSTMYGRWELAALVQTASGLASAMRAGVPVERGTPPPDLAERVKPGRRPSRSRPDVPAGDSFGAVLRQPPARVRAGAEVSAQFVGAYPNNDVRRGSTFLAVERLVEGAWVRVADDGDWATKFRWRRARRGASIVTIEWVVLADTAPGRYRLVYFGDIRDPDGTLRPLTATAEPFDVVT
jgi:neutral ceramidase